MQGQGRGAKGNDELVAELRRGGCPEEEIRRLVGADEEDESFEIWPENADALRAFLFAATQWRIASAMAGVVWLGIEHEALERAFRLYPPADLRDAWWAVQVMEAEAVWLRNEEMAKHAD